MDTYEEKYNEALEKARKLCAYPTTKPFTSDLQDIFPELKESEDERIRKRIYNYINVTLDDNESEEKEKWLAWLEKQKEFVSADFDDVWETADCNELTAPLEKYSKDAIKEMCHAWYDKGIELERRNRIEKQGEKKPAWSEEDEKYVKDLAAYFTEGLPLKYAEEDIADWFKSLKNRVQPKQEWSEEDKRNLNWVINVWNRLRRGGDAQTNPSQMEYLENFLKSLKPQTTWKPSDEQLKVLDEVIKNPHLSATEYNILTEIEEQLKKLREE